MGFILGALLSACRGSSRNLRGVIMRIPTVDTPCGGGVRPVQGCRVCRLRAYIPKP